MRPPATQDQAGWAELRAWQDDDRLGVYVRLLRTAFERDDRSAVRAQATRLLVDIPVDHTAARNLLRRLRDVGA
jgi:hypothetical protein